jgi:sugar-specific transcriptional regulator TrmB
MVENEVMIAVPVLPEALSKAINPTLSHLQSIGVRVLIMGSKDVKLDIEKFSNIVEVRIRDRLFGGGVIVDNREVVLLLGEEGKPTIAIWADHVGLVKFAKDYFQYLWDNSKQ